MLRPPIVDYRLPVSNTKVAAIATAVFIAFGTTAAPTAASVADHLHRLVLHTTRTRLTLYVCCVWHGGLV